MLRTIGNLLAGRTREPSIETNLTAARTFIIAVDEGKVVGGVNISGHFYGRRYSLQGIELDKTIRFIEEKFTPISKDLSVDYQVFIGRERERHYLDFHHGSYISMPVNHGPAIVLSPVEITIDYLVRTE